MPLNQREKERKGWGWRKNMKTKRKTDEKSTFKEPRRPSQKGGKNLAV